MFIIYVFLNLTTVKPQVAQFFLFVTCTAKDAEKKMTRAAILTPEADEIKTNVGNHPRLYNNNLLNKMSTNIEAACCMRLFSRRFLFFHGQCKQRLSGKS